MGSNPSTFNLPLIERTDSNGNSYYIGSVNFDFPMMVDLSKIDFLVFHPEDSPEDENCEDNRRYATLVIRRGIRHRDNRG